MGFPDWQETNTLANLISDALQSAGIPLLANPIQIYNTGPATITGTPGFMGLVAYPFKGQTPAAASSNWDSNTGIPTSGTKVYQKGLTGHPNMDTYTQLAINRGDKCYLCFEPSPNPPYSNADANTIITYTQNRINNGLPLAKTVVVLWQEQGNGNLTGAQVAGGYQFYVPLIRAAIPGITIAWDTAGQGLPGGVNAFDPGAGFYDLVGIDLYAQEWVRNQGSAFQKALGIALAGNKPFGVYEIGSTTGGAVSDANVIAYLQWLTNQALTILQNGGKLDMFAWWQNAGNVGGPNIISDSGDFRIPQLQALAAAVTTPAGGSGTVTIPATGNVTLAPLNPSPGGGYAPAIGLSYDIAMQLIAGAASTIPHVTAQLIFFDDDTATARAVDRMFFHAPSGSSGTLGTRIYGHGPMSGRWMQVILHNSDSVAAVAAVQINSTSRPYTAHDWRWSTADSNTVPGYSLTTGAGYANDLGAVNALNVPAGQTKSQLISLAAGKVWCRMISSGPSVTASLIMQPTTAFGTPEIWSDVLPNNSQVAFETVFPRATVLAQFTNNGAGAATVNARFILQG